MRLTLRTLLAYLDNTLDEQDAEILRRKLAESGFATQLVQRIRAMLANQSLLAPSPEAVGPVEEANVISEYLDSTLPAEQVAEIERACLESDPHLAEAAACHQILTMVLGQPAEVSPELRSRIYELPDTRIEDIAATSGSFSSVAIPDDQPTLQLQDNIPTADQSSLDSDPVEPVGVSDSGVSDAPTRLRESGAVDDFPGGPALAGSRPRTSEDGLYGGSIRPSRITPWLVFLALAGVLLFALTRIFQPLLNPGELASVSETQSPKVEVEVPPEEAPMMVDIPTPEGEPDVEESDAEFDMDELPAPNLPTPVEETARRTPVMDALREMESESTDVAKADPVETPSATEETAKPPTEVAAPAEDVAPPAPEMVAETVPPPSEDVSPPVPETPDTEEADKPKVAAIGKVMGGDTLLTAWIDGRWARLRKDVVISSGVPISCAPSFRAEILAPNEAKLTLIGPVQASWSIDDDEQPVMHVEYGRVIITAGEPNTEMKIQLGQEMLTLSLAEPQTVAAASVTHFRAPGFDPLNPSNRIPLSGVLSVQGELAVGAEGKSEKLDTKQQWVKRGKAGPKVSDLDASPAWTDPPDAADVSLEASAREGLLELLKSEQPLEIALREATLFRRSEVASLAAQSLLSLGLGDVYFSGNGILSEPKQKAYWTDHFKALVACVDRSAEAAEELKTAIGNMDSPNETPLFRLLTGYSQKQLVEGGDEELVEMLKSPSMSVRVLALENLRKITGTALYFRPDQESSVRREKDIKKWEVRQTKGDIRWKD